MKEYPMRPVSHMPKRRPSEEGVGALVVNVITLFVMLLLAALVLSPVVWLVVHVYGWALR